MAYEQGIKPEGKVTDQLDDWEEWVKKLLAKPYQDERIEELVRRVRAGDRKATLELTRTEDGE